jgi:hypothetical protein
LSIITAKPDPTEDSRLASIIVEVRQLEFVVNSVVGYRSWCTCSGGGIKLHIVVSIVGSFLFANERESRVKSDRLSLPCRDVLAVSVSVVDVIMDAYFEIVDTVLLERSHVAISVLRARAKRQTLQLSLVLRNEIDEVGSLVLRCDMNRNPDVFSSVPITTFIISPKEWR